tara:strand:+ start:1075 stop:1182 length:108 start_codon:yes stop_codon:yes gene_type:complete
MKIIRKEWKEEKRRREEGRENNTSGKGDSNEWKNE